MQHQVRKYFDSNKGLDLKSSDLNRSPRFASSMLNAQYRQSGAPEKRKGFQIHSDPSGGYGLFNYRRVDENDLLEEIVIDVGRNVNRMKFTVINVSYSGAEAAAFLSFYFDPTSDQYRCTIVAGLTTVLDFPVGKGYDEATPVTVEDLKDAINAVSDFTASVMGDDQVPAAYLRIIRDIDVKETAWEGRAVYWEQVNQAVSNPFDGSYTRQANLDFENVSGVVMRNVLYLSNGYDYLYKYDGQNLFRAGLPAPAVPTSTLSGAGAITGNNYVHRVQYVQVDAVGNFVESNPTGVATPINAAAQQIAVTVPNLQTSGFNLNAAIVAGAQALVNTITVDNGSGGGHTMKAGDTAYFFDGVSSSYVERRVTGITGSTITVAGAAVTVADNAVISNNLRILIMRNESSAITPSVFFVVAELPNNPFTATQSHTDNLADASLGDLVEPPQADRSPPPKGKYLATFQNLLFVSGNPSDPTKFFWSDIDSPEYFPAGTNEDRFENSKGESITGIGGGTSIFAIFTKSSTGVGSGTFADLNYRVEEKASNIGCESHASITLMEGYLVWWSARGPYSMAGGQLPVALGANPDGEARIAPVMDQPGFESNPNYMELAFRAKRCISFAWNAENKVLFYLPAENESGPDRYPNGNSRVYAYDFSRDAWLEWSNLNMIGGVCQYEDEVFFKARRLDETDSLVSDLRRFHNLNDSWDYEDNDQPIEWEYGPQWEDLGEPGVLKKFLELQIFSLEEVSNSDLNVVVRQEVNFQRDAGVSEFTMQITGSGYGQSQYGVDPYGDPINPRLKHELTRTRTYSTRTVFTNDEHQKNCVISGWELLFVAPFRAEFKK